MATSFQDRLRRAGPTGTMVAEVLQEVIDAVNEVVRIVAVGQAPHKANDTTNVVTLDDASSDVDSIIDLSQQEITKFEAHLASTSHHIAADTTNVVTETGVPIEVYTLLNELKTDVNAHMADGTAHTNDDDVTAAVAAANATTKATAITLANAVRVAYEAHRVRLEDVATNPVHGAADATNTVTPTALAADATWTQIAALADALRTAYEAHRVLTGGSVHAFADATNTIAATAVGTVATALYAGLNELKGDFNAHIRESGTSHYMLDASMEVTAANASSTATARTLVNEIKESYNDHISRAEEAGRLVLNLDERS